MLRYFDLVFLSANCYFKFFKKRSFTFNEIRIQSEFLTSNQSKTFNKLSLKKEKHNNLKLIEMRNNLSIESITEPRTIAIVIFLNLSTFSC